MYARSRKKFFKTNPTSPPLRGEGSIVMKNNIATIEASYKLTFNNETLDQMIAEGKYYCVVNVTSENFPYNPKTGEVEVTLVTFQEDLLWSDVEGELSKLGLKSAGVGELCMLAIQHPEVTTKYEEGNKLVVIQGELFGGVVPYSPCIRDVGPSRILYCTFSTGVETQKWGGGKVWHHLAVKI